MLIGTVFVVLFFGDRLNLFSSWLPNERVLVRLQQTELKMTEKAKCQMECLDIERKHIDELIKNGNIDFKNSKVHEKPLIYIVEHSMEKVFEYKLTFAAADSTSTIINMERNDVKRACNCDD